MSNLLSSVLPMEAEDNLALDTASAITQMLHPPHTVHCTVQCKIRVHTV